MVGSRGISYLIICTGASVRPVIKAWRDRLPGRPNFARSRSDPYFGTDAFAGQFYSEPLQVFILNRVFLLQQNM